MGKTWLGLGGVVLVGGFFACSSSNDTTPGNTPVTPTPIPTPVASSTATSVVDSGPAPVDAGTDAGDDDDSDNFGGDPAAEAAVRAVRIVPPGALTNPVSTIKVPTSFMLTDLPPVTQQGTATKPGSPGSCEAQSFGYALGTYTAAHDPTGALLFDPSSDANRISAAWLYGSVLSKEARACPVGTLATDYLAQLVRGGAASYADQPYQPTCAFLSAVDSAKTYADDSKFTIGSYAMHPLSTLQAAFVKSQLVSGRMVAFSGPVCSGYPKDPPLNNGVFYCADGTIANSGHGQVVVGFDDAKGDPANPGAFLIQNSFGTDWPSAGAGGRIWMSYDAFMTTQTTIGVAYPVRATATGTAVTGTGPAGTVARAWQFTNAAGDTWLLLDYHFADWLTINTVTMTSPGGTTATGNYGQPIRDGYSYFYRGDGNSFTAGNYQLTLAATLKDGSTTTYSATVAVAAGAPASLPAADFPATGLVDSTLIAAAIH